MTPALEPAACLQTAWQVAPDLPVRLGVLAGLMALAGWADAQRHFPGRRAFFWLNLVLALWLAGTTTEHAAVEAACKGTVALLSWPFVLALPPLWMLFLWRYVTGGLRAPTPRLAATTVVAYGALVAAVLSNGGHGAFYGPASGLGPPVYGLARMRYAYGPLFHGAAAWGYAWLAAAAVLIVRTLRDSAPDDRPQWTAMLVMMLVPWACNFAYLVLGVRLLGGDPTPLSFAVAVAGFGWLIRNSSFLRVVPLSRRLLFAALPDPVLVLDAQGRVIDCNATAQRLAGAPLPRGSALADCPGFGAPLAELLARPDGAHGTLAVAGCGAVMDVRATEIEHRGHRIGRLLQLRDVTERHRQQTALAEALAQRDARLQQVAALETELRDQAQRDPLTGLLNRRALAERFALESRHLAAAGGALSLVLLDVDHFKRINDAFGHATGDAVLQALARTLSERVRSSDSVYRIGGEEFALLLPHAERAQAAQRTQALREAVRGAVRQPDGAVVDFSAGVATAPDGRATLDELLGQADAALYAAKRGGRGRTVQAEVGLAPAVESQVKES